MPEEPSKMTGEVNSIIGQAKESIGHLTGMQSLENSGKEQHAKGEAEVKAAQAKGYTEGTKDRLVGKKDEIVGGITGDSTQEASGKAQGASGKVQQEANK